MFRGNMVGEHRKGAYTMLCTILHWLPSDFLPFFACQAALFFVDYQLSYLSLEALLFKVGLSSVRKNAGKSVVSTSVIGLV
jgi:hypothetical protein